MPDSMQGRVPITLRVLFALAFLAAAAMKLSGQPQMIWASSGCVCMAI